MGALPRRLVSIPAVCLGWVLALATAPVWLPLALLAGALRRRGFIALRCGLFLVWVLSLEIYGFVSLLAIEVARVLTRADRERYHEWSFRLQCRWARAHLLGGGRIWRLRFALEGEEQLSGESVLLFVRHTSLADTVLPAVFVQAPHDLRLRYVMKRELLWEPCLDIVGHRLDCCFVDRYSEDSTREIERVASTMDGLAPNEGVVIWPEGTRPTPEKRRRALARLEEKDPALFARTRDFQRLLPPRPGGPLALLERNRGLDAAFLVHTGFEQVATLGDFTSGALLDRTVRMKVWRVPFAEIPREREARLDWLCEHWRRMDDWVVANEDLGEER